MSSLSSMEHTISEFFTGGQQASPPLGLTISNIDVNAVLEVVNAIVSAAPAIVEGAQSAAPFVEAICVLISNGGKPTEAQWADLRTRLDANSGTLANAEAEAQSEIDASATVEASAEAPVEVATGVVPIEPPVQAPADIKMTHTDIRAGENGTAEESSK